MINYEKDNFDESLEDIMKSVNSILGDIGVGFETDEDLYEDKKNFNK